MTDALLTPLINLLTNAATEMAAKVVGGAIKAAVATTNPDPALAMKSFAWELQIEPSSGSETCVSGSRAFEILSEGGGSSLVGEFVDTRLGRFSFSGRRGKDGVMYGGVAQGDRHTLSFRGTLTLENGGGVYESGFACQGKWTAKPIQVASAYAHTIVGEPPPEGPSPRIAAEPAIVVAQGNQREEIPCDQSLVFFNDRYKCFAGKDENSSNSVVSGMRRYSTYGGDSDFGFSALLFWPHDRSIMVPYSASVSERAIKTFNSYTQAGTEWSQYLGNKNTGYMSFRYNGMFCIGFDHAGANKGEVSGYSYIVRGYLCEKKKPTDLGARLDQFLASVRVGSASAQKNALGNSLLPSVAFLATTMSEGVGNPEPRPSSAAVQPPVAASPPQIAAAPVLPPSPAPTPTAQNTVPFALNWEGVAPLAAGLMSYTDNSAGSGDLNVTLPDGKGTCRGMWRFVSGKYGTSDLPTGTWTLACTNGQAGSGTYRSNEPGKGAGEGMDAQGRKIALSYGR